MFFSQIVWLVTSVMGTCLSPKLHGKYFKGIMNSQYWPSGISSHMNAHCVLHSHSLSVVGLPLRLKPPLRYNHLPCFCQRHPCKTHGSNPKTPPKQDMNYRLQDWWTVTVSPWKHVYFPGTERGKLVPISNIWIKGKCLASCAKGSSLRRDLMSC